MIHTIIRDLDEEEMKTLIKCLGNWIYFQRRQRGVTGEIRWLLFVFTMSQPARFCGGRTCLTKFIKYETNRVENIDDAFAFSV